VAGKPVKFRVGSASGSHGCELPDDAGAAPIDAGMHQRVFLVMIEFVDGVVQRLVVGSGKGAIHARGAN
jgi:hypothetical protein